MHRIVYLERDSVRADVRRPAFAHEWVEYPRTTPAELEAHLAGATIAIVNKLSFTAELIGRLPDLQLIAVSATGSRIVAMSFCEPRS